MTCLLIHRLYNIHRGGRVLAARTYGGGRGPIWLDDMECNGTESNIAGCVHKPWGVNNCGHDEDVAVTCLPSMFVGT